MTDALPNIVEFRNVTKRFGDLTVIRDVTFTVPDLPGTGEFVTILGPSGCGKSTVLRLIAGLPPHHPTTEGTVHVANAPVAGPGSDRGMVFQDYTSFDNRTVEDNVAFGLECRGVGAKERREQARAWIEKVGLDVKRDAHKYPSQLSGGMRQRVAIARTLILRPRIILMDEPFGALDPSTRLHMQELLNKLWREAEATVFFVTHSIEEAVYLGDRVYVFSSSPGTILREIAVPKSDRPPREMQREKAVRRAGRRPPRYRRYAAVVHARRRLGACPSKYGEHHSSADPVRSVLEAAAGGRARGLPEGGVPLPVEPAVLSRRAGGRGDRAAVRRHASSRLRRRARLPGRAHVAAAISRRHRCQGACRAGDDGRGDDDSAVARRHAGRIARRAAEALRAAARTLRGDAAPGGGRPRSVGTRCRIG